MSTFTPHNTPWGRADLIEPLGSGIFKVGTPEHGGIFVPDDLIARLPDALCRQNGYSGFGNWFEEDLEWALPVIAFPELFSARLCYYAVLSIRAYNDAKPGEYLFSAARWLREDPAAWAVKSKAETWAEKLIEAEAIA